MSVWDELSPDVGAIITNGQKREQERKLTPAQRKERDRQAKRVRLVYDGPQWLKDEVKRIAQVELCSASTLGARLLAEGLRAYRAGNVELEKTPSKSPRFEFLIVVTQENANFSG